MSGAKGEPGSPGVKVSLLRFAGLEFFFVLNYRVCELNRSFLKSVGSDSNSAER